MQAVILAGGLGTRLGEETSLRPKPMVEIGGMPILWHIMKIYSAHGVNDFVICLGYKGYVIKEFFFNYHIHMADVTFDLRDHSTVVHRKRAEPVQPEAKPGALKPGMPEDQNPLAGPEARQWLHQVFHGAFPLPHSSSS